LGTALQFDLLFVIFMFCVSRHFGIEIKAFSVIFEGFDLGF